MRRGITGDIERLRQLQLLREAEGYLALITPLESGLELAPAVRNQLAFRALQALDRLGICHRKQARVCYLRGQALSAMEDFSSAVRPLEAAASLEAENLNVWLALGWCYKRLGRLDLAIQSLEEALVIEPGQAIVSYNLACYWSLAGNGQLAVHYLSRAFDLDPDYRDLVPQETDFDPIRGQAAFRQLTSVAV